MKIEKNFIKNLEYCFTVVSRYNKDKKNRNTKKFKDSKTVLRVWENETQFLAMDENPLNAHNQKQQTTL